MNWGAFFAVLGYCAVSCAFAVATIAFINWAAKRGLPGAVAVGVPVAVLFLTAATVAGVATS